MKKAIFAGLIGSLIIIGSISGVLAQGPVAAPNAKAAETLPPPPREKFDPAKDPNVELQAAITAAAKENKRIILDVGGEWCVWCIKMDNFVAAHADLKKLRDENFLWVKINMSDENENKAFLSKYPAIEGYPHLFVLEKDGSLLKSKDTSEIEEADLPIVIPADVKDKEKAMQEAKEKKRARSYNLQKFTDFLKEYSPAKN